MPHWRIQTAPARDGEALTGNYSDSDLAFRLTCWVDMICKGAAQLAEAQRGFDADVASGHRNGQHRIIEEALKRLAERRSR